MTNLYQERCKRMSLEEIAEEAEYHGRVINMLAGKNMSLSKEDKSRILICFEECLNRPELQPEHDLLKTVLLVLKYL